MATTTSTPRGASQGPRVRGSGAARRSEQRGDADQQYDLLTAALIGAVLGAGTTLLFRPRKRRVMLPGAEVARGAARAATIVTKAGRRGARKMRKRGHEIDETLRDYIGAAREQIDEVVSPELRDLRKALRRQRKRLGI